MRQMTQTRQVYNEELGLYEWKEVETDKYVFDETDMIAIAREYHERRCPASDIVSKYHISSAVMLYGWLDKYLNEKVCVSLQPETDNETDMSKKSKQQLGKSDSIYSMMHKIFDNGDQPLYVRRNANLRLLPFSIATLKTILHDHNPNYRPDDLLCLYMLTGGVAKYVALLMDNDAVTQQRMLNYAISPDSPFRQSGGSAIGICRLQV